jgi:hypothetical protein
MRVADGVTRVCQEILSGVENGKVNKRVNSYSGLQNRERYTRVVIKGGGSSDHV